jgi:hypothetical protein
MTVPLTQPLPTRILASSPRVQALSTREPNGPYSCTYPSIPRSKLFIPHSGKLALEAARVPTSYLGQTLEVRRAQQRAEPRLLDRTLRCATPVDR